MSSFDNSGSRRRGGVWSHWVPLAVTVTVATAGLAAWVWKQRKDDDGPEQNNNENTVGLDYEHGDYGDNPAYGATSRSQPKVPRSSHNPGEQTQGTINLQPDPNEAGWSARMSGALRRTPSPQQFFEHAGKSVSAGMAAASAAAGRALAAIREEDKAAFNDHETWSEEADARKERPDDGRPRDPNKRRRTVAIIVSADNNVQEDDDGFMEHASILSHIPRDIDFSQVKLFVLIYAPGLKEIGLDSTSNLPPPSLSSSFSNIEHHQAQTPGTDDPSKSPLVEAATSPAYNAVHSQALSLVEKETRILPFTTPNGYAPMLRHVQPEIVYLQESLAGDNGNVVTNLQSWHRHDIILVVGAESGHGGLADSESEAEKAEPEQKWWQRPERVGRGRGVVVVDSMRISDDWARRVQGQD